MEDDDIIKKDRVKNIFISLGWKKSFIDQELKDHNDSNSVDGSIYMYTQKWSDTFVKNCPIQDTKDKQNTRHFKKILKLCGFNHETIKELIRIIHPLYNTCYSYIHLYDICLEYLGLNFR